MVANRYRQIGPAFGHGSHCMCSLGQGTDEIAKQPGNRERKKSENKKKYENTIKGISQNDIQHTLIIIDNQIALRTRRPRFSNPYTLIIAGHFPDRFAALHNLPGFIPEFFLFQIAGGIIFCDKIGIPVINCTEGDFGRPVLGYDSLKELHIIKLIRDIDTFNGGFDEVINTLIEVVMAVGNIDNGEQCNDRERCQKDNAQNQIEGSCYNRFVCLHEYRP